MRLNYIHQRFSFNRYNGPISAIVHANLLLHTVGVKNVQHAQINYVDNTFSVHHQQLRSGHNCQLS